MSCDHQSRLPRCCLICQMLRRRRRTAKDGLHPRPGRYNTIAQRVELARQALEAQLDLADAGTGSRSRPGSRSDQSASPH